MKRILLTAISIGATLLLLFLITGCSTPRDQRAEVALEYCKETCHSKVVETVESSSKPLMMWVYE